MKFVTYNIQYGRGKDERFDLERIAGEVAGADVIALQEVERFWQRSGMVDQPAELARLLDGYHWVYGAGVDVDAGTTDDAGKPVHRRRQFGNMLLSKTLILTSRNHLLPKYATLKPLSLQRAALEGVVATAAGAARLYSVHLTHLSAETRLPQIDHLWHVHRRAVIEGAPITGSDRLPAEWIQDGIPGAMPREAIIMGDFNFEPDSEEYKRMVGPSAGPYGGRMTNPDGFVDAWVAAGHKEDEGMTAAIRDRPVRLDYLFVSTALRDRIKSVEIDNAAQGSDHQPVWMEIDL